MKGNRKRMRFRILCILLLLPFLMLAVGRPAVADTGSFRGNKSYSRKKDTKKEERKEKKEEKEEKEEKNAAPVTKDRDDDDKRSGGTYRGPAPSTEKLGATGWIVGVVGLLIFGGIIFLIILGIRKAKEKVEERRDEKWLKDYRESGAGGGSGTDIGDDEESSRILTDREGMAEAEETLRSRNPGFSMEALKQHLADLYVTMQTHWTKKDWEPMREHMSSQLYNQLNAQVEEMKRDRLVNRMDHIHVRKVFFMDYQRDEVNDILHFRLYVDLLDYTVELATGDVIVGSAEDPVYMLYEWEVIRSLTAKTHDGSEADGESMMTCPSCGAPMDINASTKCPYCGSIVESKDYDWIINQMEGLEQSDSPLDE